MEKIIEKAIDEGKYEPFKTLHMEYCKKVNYMSHCLVVEPGEGGIASRNYTEMVLDPLFWQALQEASHWGVVDKFYCGNKECKQYNDKNNSWTSRGYCRFCGVMQLQYSENTGNPDWMFFAIQFHTKNLRSGWEKAVEFLQEVTK